MLQKLIVPLLYQRLQGNVLWKYKNETTGGDQKWIYVACGIFTNVNVHALQTFWKTISAYHNWFHQLMIDNIDPQKHIIGGEGIEVQIDELKFAKLKYHRGHRVGDGSWLFGGIDKNKNLFAVVVQNRK